MKTRYITIEREFGSGGTQIAHMTADICKIPCYGIEILEHISKAYKIPIEKIEQYEENVTNSFLYSVFMLGKIQRGESEVVAGEGQIYLAEQAIIRQFAAKGPAVFLGHCASEALKDRPGVVKVFVRSDPVSKCRRILEEYQIPKERLEETIRRQDKRRSNYYHANTNRRWDDPKNYDIVLDSGSLGIKDCARLLAGLMTELS